MGAAGDIGFSWEFVEDEAEEFEGEEEVEEDFGFYVDGEDEEEQEGDGLIGAQEAEEGDKAHGACGCAE